MSADNAGVTVSEAKASEPIRLTGRYRGLVPYVKGQSGNPSGRPKGSIRRAVIARLSEAKGKDKTYLRAVVEAVVREAVKGDVRAFAEIRDTVDGRPGPSDVEGAPPAPPVVVNVLQVLAGAPDDVLEKLLAAARAQQAVEAEVVK